MINKKDSADYRFCVDFRTLNDNTIRDTYPVPNVQDLIDATKGSRFFSQVDLASGYWGVPIHKEDRHKTAFMVPSGKYEFIRMPFGLCNAQSTFQRNMDGVVQEVNEKGFGGLAAYVDNILVYTETFEEHLATLHALFESMDKARLTLRRDKCEFGKDSIQFLGFVINGEDVKIDPANIDKIRHFPTPKTRKQLRRFLGMANFGRRFIKHYYELTSVLNSLTSIKVPFEWLEVHQSAFEKLKIELAKAVSLIIPDFSKEFHIRTDASDIAVGAVLYQLDDSGEQLPVAFHSKPLQKQKRIGKLVKKNFTVL